MPNQLWLVVLARLVAVGYFGMTCVYCLLYFMPFTYVQLLESELVPALVFFERVHAWLFFLVVALLDLSVRQTDPTAAARWLRRGFRVVMTAGGVLLVSRPVLPNLENNLGAFIWSQVALVPLLWVAAIDLAAVRGRLRWSKSSGGEERLLITAAMAAALSWMISTAVAFARPGITTTLTTSELGVGAGWSLSAHVMLFLGFATGLLLVRGIASMSRQPALIEAVVLGVLSTLLLGSVIDRTVFAALAFTGPFANLAATTLSAALVVSLLAVAARRHLSRDEPILDGFAFAFGAATPAPEGSTRFGGIWVAGIAASAWFLLTSLAPVDWNFLLQRLGIVAVWVATFATCHTMLRFRAHTLQGLVLSTIVPLGALGIFRGVGPVGEGIVGSVAPGRTVQNTLERYAGYEVSVGLFQSWLRSRPEKWTPKPGQRLKWNLHRVSGRRAEAGCAEVHHIWRPPTK